MSEILNITKVPGWVKKAEKAIEDGHPIPTPPEGWVIVDLKDPHDPKRGYDHSWYSDPGYFWKHMLVYAEDKRYEYRYVTRDKYGGKRKIAAKRMSGPFESTLDDVREEKRQKNPRPPRPQVMKSYVVRGGSYCWASVEVVASNAEEAKTKGQNLVRDKLSKAVDGDMGHGVNNLTARALKNVITKEFLA